MSDRIYTIYKITNQHPGKSFGKGYVGITVRQPPTKRWTDHIRSATSGSEKLLIWRGKLYV